MIARAGRLALVTVVVSAKPMHHLLTMEAPISALKEIEKCARSFFWTGKKEMNGGQYLVSWAKVSRSEQLGGLVVKDLKLQGLAL